MNTKTDKAHALFVARKIHAILVYNMAALEGNPFTFPEVKTLLEGVTVGGHKISDQDQVLRIANGWKRLLSLVEQDAFALTKAVAVELNAIVAKGEALEVGGFRSGQVGIEGTDYQPPPADELDARFAQLAKRTLEGRLPESAHRYFLEAAAAQFLWDGNKRTALLMANGLLLQSGYLPLSVPAARRLEYNKKMVRFYDTGDDAPMLAFMANCSQEIAAPFVGYTHSSIPSP